jgi:hypothetical protein
LLFRSALSTSGHWVQVPWRLALRSATGREDVREHRQVEDLLQRRFLVGKLQQVPVGVRDHDVLGVAADPTAWSLAYSASPVGVRSLAGESCSVQAGVSECCG